MTRQTFTPEQIAEISRQLRPMMQAEAKAATDKLCAAAFVGGDTSPAEACALHRTMQKKHIDRENRWSDRFDKILTNVINSTVLGAAAIGAIALWEYIKRKAAE